MLNILMSLPKSYFITFSSFLGKILWTFGTTFKLNFVGRKLIPVNRLQVYVFTNFMYTVYILNKRGLPERVNSSNRSMYFIYATYCLLFIILYWARYVNICTEEDTVDNILLFMLCTLRIVYMLLCILENTGVKYFCSIRVYPLVLKSLYMWFILTVSFLFACVWKGTIS